MPPQGEPAQDGGREDGNASDGADGCVPGLPPAGLAQLVPGDASGANAAMATDSQGSPIVAHARTTAPDNTWNYACSAWSAPIVVDTIGSQGASGRQIALAYDKSTGALGIAYQAIIGVFGMNHHYELRHAILAKGATTFSAPERVEEPKDNDHAPATPGLAMANGKVSITYTEAFRICGTSNCGAVVYRSKEVVSGSSVDDGSAAFGTPKILTASDLQSFTVGGVPKAVYAGSAASPSAPFGPDGKLQIAMRGPAMSDPTKVGLLYYREP